MWTSPESLLRDLQSPEKAVRLRVLRLLGVEATEFFDENRPEVSLRYASLGNDQTRQAIIQVAALSRAYAVVAVPTADGWERIATFDSILRYRTQPTLNDLLRVEFADHDDVYPGIPFKRPAVELVLRASGGGSGLYEETEDRFWMHNGEFRHVLTFVTKYDSFIAGSGGMTVHERRWFRDSQLVEARATVSSEEEISWDLTEPTRFKSVSCTPYKWDAASFKYVRSGPARPCKHEPPK